jgi:DNA invertase Pin-like site-specific DNA recombinase
MEIVRSYSDHGRSGLDLSGRRGLRSLLDDVARGTQDFSELLVYDISRWGRFQDADESAYYEYVLKRAGIRTHYCAENFSNDGSLSSILLKTVKRAMAGEYSRELSAKVFAGQCRLIGLGFRQGGVAGYGFRRLLVDKDGNPKTVLDLREHKNIQTDRVILVPGPQAEADVVASIYKSFIGLRKGETDIAADLNARGLTSQFGKRWTTWQVHQILVNQKYAGADMYNRTSGKLRKKRISNPPDLWIRSGNALEPLVTNEEFKSAQDRIRARSRNWTDKELLDGLRELLRTVGHLSTRIINEAGNQPKSGVYVKRFGGLSQTYDLIGWQPARDNSYCAVNRRLAAQRRILVELVLKSSVTGSITTDLTDPRGLLLINQEFTVSIRLARCHELPDGHYWRVHTNCLRKSDVSLIARMRPGNDSILDYYVFPSAEIRVRKLCFRNSNKAALDAYRFDDLEFFLSLCKRKQIEGVHHADRNFRHTHLGDSDHQSP